MHALCTRTSFTLADGRTLACTMSPDRDDEPPLYTLDDVPVAFDDLPHGLSTIAEAMASCESWQYNPTQFDPFIYD
jgi:hypothetical protein